MLLVQPGAHAHDLAHCPLSKVSTWFANARRRLKKENKVTWSPRANKGSDDRGLDDDSDGGEESMEEQPMKSIAGMYASPHVTTGL